MYVHKLSSGGVVPPPHAVRVESPERHETIRQVWLCEIGIDLLTRGTVGAHVGDSNQVLKTKFINVVRG